MFEKREQAIQFLTGRHSDSNTGREVLRPMVDLRNLGCPDRIFNRLLEQRARKLGLSEMEFRKLMNISDTPAPSSVPEVQITKLF